MGQNNHINLLAVLLVLFIGLNSFESFSQFERVEQITTFYTRIDNPVTIEVTEHQGRFRFAAVNRSQYPYEVEIAFNVMINLTPHITSRKYLAGPGRTHLFELRKNIENLNYDFNYSVRTSIGNPGNIPDTLFPYLIPLKPGRAVDFVAFEMLDNVKIVSNIFASEPGEPILNMRKGKVTAVYTSRSHTPVFFQDKISPLSSVEILHRDGTIAIYDGIDPDFLFVNTGDIVYPGQQLGLTDPEGMITVQLFQMVEGGKLQQLNIQFAINEELSVPFKDLFDKKIYHPAGVVEREMTRRERRLFRSGNLF